MNPKETEAYLEEIGKTGSILGLDSIRSLMKELSDVQDELKVIHVAGTNGKGSVCAMISSMLAEAGCRVGKYTSPAVFVPEERYQINGVNITPTEFAAIISQVKEGCDRMVRAGRSQPTVFEVETAAAFLYFYQKKCDLVVLETGMGGAEDATNIIRKPLVSVLTSVSRDHMKFLGNTLEEIARAKAGIIKPGGTAVVMRQDPRVCRVAEEVCREKHARLIYADSKGARHVRISGSRLWFSYGEFSDISLGMLGSCQIQNAVCALETVKYLGEHRIAVSREQMEQGIAKARWDGRFSILSEMPMFVIDGAHNEGAAKKLRETLEMGFTNRKIIYIIGVLADKEHEKMLECMLPLAERVFTVTPDNPRALDGALLAKEARKYHGNVTYVPKIKEAVERALALAEQENAMVLSFGSLSYLGEVKKNLEEIKEHDR